MSSQGNKDISAEAVSMEQSSTSGTKRKRGRPRKYEYPSHELPHRAQPIQSIPPLQSIQGCSNIRQDGVQARSTSGEDKGDILGKRFVGKMTKKYPGFCLITVKVKDNQVLKGWIPDQKNLNDLTPELPVLRPSQVQKQASAIPMQAAPPVPIHLEDVTLAKPLQMRRPVDKTIAMHAVPLTTKAYMSSSSVAAVPVSVSRSTIETEKLTKQDTECMISPSPVAAVPITSVRPVFVSDKQVANQNELVGEKSFNDFQKDHVLPNGAKDLSVKAEKPNVALVDIAVKDSLVEHKLLNVQGTDEVGESSVSIRENINQEISPGTRAQANSANSDHLSSGEASDIAEKSDQLKTETDVLKEVDDLKSNAPDDVHSTQNEG